MSTPDAGPAQLPAVVIKGGTVVNAADCRDATVVAQDGQITAILAPDAPLPDLGQETKIIDAAGCQVLPGGVDPHVHVATSLGEYQTADGHADASIAALVGGTTTMVDFAIPDGGLSPLEAVDGRIRLAASARCHVVLHGCVTQAFSGDVAAQLAGMVERGIRTVKVFTTYRDAFMATDDQIFQVLCSMRDAGGLTYVHAEWDPLVFRLQADHEARHRSVSAEHHVMRPVDVEVVAVRQVLTVAEALGAPVYFVHLSSPLSLADVRAARGRGLHAYAETCPHYLLLTDEKYRSPAGPEYLCCPPLRGKAVTAQLMESAGAGQIDTIGSDHCCFTREQKYRRQDVRQAPFGLPGVETRMPLMIDELAVRRSVPWPQVVGMLCATPARLNGIYPRKGTIAVGSDADIVIIDPQRNRRSLRSSDMHMPTDIEPYADHEPVAWPLWVISSGRVVVNDGTFADPGPGPGYLASDAVGPW
jgi:dihydropyrimidinase